METVKPLNNNSNIANPIAMTITNSNPGDELLFKL